MQVTITELSPVEKKIAIEVPWPYVARKLDDAYRELGKGVALKGFRKGKVPRPMLEKLFGRQVEQDVVQKLVQESFVFAAHEHQIEPVAEPVVDDVHLHKGQSFHFSARVEVRSKIEPTDYDGVEVTQRASKVSEADVDRALQQKREELTEFRTIENRDPKVSGKSDVLVLKLRGKVGEKDIERDGIMVDLSNPEREYIPGLTQELIGIPLDAADHVVQFVVPAAAEDAPEARKTLDGKPVSLTLSVIEAREKHMPELDDEFAKDTGEADTLAELRDKVKERLLKDDEARAKGELREQLVKEILKKNSFVVAPALVERQLDVMLQRAKLGMAMRGIDVRNAMLDEQRLRDELREEANDEVRGLLLLDAIAEKEKVQASEADLEKRLAEMAQAREKSVARLKADLQKEGRLESIRHQVREEKTLDLLLSRAKITVKADEA
jgi:trigger factor